MAGSDADTLTEKQRAVLDLVLEHKSSKEIARNLGISPHTVDQRIATARRKLGASTRAELARRYARHRSAYEETTYQSSYVEVPGADEHPVDRVQPVGPVFTLEDVQPIQLDAPWQRKSLSLAGLEALDSRFGILGRIVAIVGLAAVMAIMVLAMAAIAETLTRLV